jgi:uncharacterized protein
MNSDNPKIQTLLTLGQPEHNSHWPDYPSLYGFTPEDIPSLLTLFMDEEINAINSDSPELWAQLYAWRILGQLGSEEAIVPIVQSFDTLFDDDYALSELSKVIGMIGPAAIPALRDYLQQTGKDEFSYVLAMDSLSEIALRQPACREQVLGIFMEYMAKPFISARTLNGLLIARLLDLQATECIEAIRELFAHDCVDIRCAGDLEEVEIILGFRSHRSTPKMTTAEMYGVPDPFNSAELDDDDLDIFEVIDHYLLRYGSDQSILGSSELDGFYAALACAPQTINPSVWVPVIWGGDELMPEWENQTEVTQFTQASLQHYNIVIADFLDKVYDPLFMGDINHESELFIVDDWCEGFLRGLSLWGELSPADLQVLENYIHPILFFSSDESIDVLETMSVAEIQELQASIQPGLLDLYQHFFKPVKTSNTTFVHSSAKVGRNEPCPCGSGKKYKKCCGLN